MSTNKELPASADTGKPSLLGYESLLKEIFPDEATRPSTRWLKRLQAQRLVPFKKVGKRVFFDPVEVRGALDRNFSVIDRGQQPGAR